MADDDQNTEQPAAESGGKKKLISLIILAIVVAAMSVGGTLAALKFLAPPAAQDSEATAESDQPPPPAPAIYYPLKPSILANFEYRGRQRYLQLDITLLMREDDVIAAIETHMPMIRNGLNMLISGQLYEELQTAEGKEILRQQCLQEIQRLLQKEINKPGVEQVLFTSFILQ